MSKPVSADQSQLRLRLEADAILLIPGHLRAKDLDLIVSPAHAVEISAIEAIEREQLQICRRRTERASLSMCRAPVNAPSKMPNQT